MIKCKACGNDMEMKDVKDHPGHLEILCTTCINKARLAYQTDEWSFEGLYWDRREGCDDAEFELERPITFTP